MNATAIIAATMSPDLTGSLIFFFAITFLKRQGDFTAALPLTKHKL